ncbi:MAG: bifunctional 2-C-methyl-D-erythritol 4-phosphate cytidylyltransferase/2-C-methyl-D-erythritol 2,4-cyclodiphosphate synthase [Alphaproteobacteria bacterium]|nr:bifunctional 2-C-methyl-D-erythritol 4-phosphate cytidylyltransferase/2-C-methyl-D-erythritol 2,4-cyclodiphosphate synthase [Alphaproteobacteria bacterium]
MSVHNQNRKIFALIVAGGQGNRFGSELPKQYCQLNGKTVIDHAITPFLNHTAITGVQVVIGKGTESLYESSLQGLNLLPVAYGGTTRQESVFRGLEALKAHKPDLVLIHDAARPYITDALINRVVHSLDHAKACIPVISVTDTIKRTENNIVKETIDRSTLRRVQTPQGFCFSTIFSLHQQFSDNPTFTDDALLCEAGGIPVHCVDGEEENIKITVTKDLPKMIDIRVGNGIDVHQIGPGDGVTLFGVYIPCGFSLIGHSDADVGLHSITDALLGAIADADIGYHFSPKDERWRGADSEQFLKHAADKVRTMGGKINHIDATLMGEKPKVSPLRDQMRQRVAEILEIDIRRVSIKATTTEKLGFCGREEGLAVLANATVILG